MVAHASVRSSESVQARWSTAERSQNEPSTAASCCATSDARSGARWRAASSHMSSISTIAYSESVPPQSKITASRRAPSEPVTPLVLLVERHLARGDGDAQMVLGWRQRAGPVLVVRAVGVVGVVEVDQQTAVLELVQL